MLYNITVGGDGPRKTGDRDDNHFSPAHRREEGTRSDEPAA